MKPWLDGVFLSFEQYVTVLGLDVYYYFCLIHNSGWRYSCCLRVGLLRVFQRAMNEWEFVFWFSLCCFVYLFHLFYYNVMGICEGDFMVIAYEWWLDEIIHCLQEADHRLGCFVSLVAVSHMLKMIMKPASHNDSVSVLKSHLFFC